MHDQHPIGQNVLRTEEEEGVIQVLACLQDRQGERSATRHCDYRLTYNTSRHFVIPDRGKSGTHSDPSSNAASVIHRENADSSSLHLAVIFLNGT